MNNLTKPEKIRKIHEIVKEKNVTAYEIGKNTDVSIFAAQKILNGETKNPNMRTLDTILSYLDPTLENPKTPERIVLNKLSEPNYTYPSKNDQILSAIERLELLIRQKHAVFSQALEISLLDTTEIREHTKTILKNTEDVPRSFERLTALIQKRLGAS